MAITFDKLVASPKYQSLDEKMKQKARASFVQDFVAKDPKFQRMSVPAKTKIVDSILFGSVPDEKFKQSKAYTELVAPLMHAGSAYLFDAPKAAVAKGGEAMGLSKEQSLESVFPEQTTLPGKALRVTASIPAYVAGAVQRGLVKGAQKVGGAVTAKMAPGLGKNVVRMATEGAAVTAPYAASQAIYDKPENAAATMVAGTALGGALPLAGSALKAGAKGAGKIGNELINTLVKPRQTELAYGANPGRTVNDLVGVSKSADELLSKIVAVKEKLWEDTQNVLMSSGKKLDISRAIGAIDEEIAELSKMPSANQSKITKLQGIKDDLLANVKGDLKNIGVEEAWNLKKLVSSVTKFKGIESDDMAVNATMKAVYGRISDALKKAEPRLKKQFEQYGDLATAERALERRIRQVQSHEPLGLLDAAIATAGGIATQSIPGALMATALLRVSRSSLFKTSVGRLLRNIGKTPDEIEKAFNRMRVVEGDNLRRFKEKDPRLNAVDAVILDPQGESYVMIGNKVIPAKQLAGPEQRIGLPNLSAEGSGAQYRGVRPKPTITPSTGAGSEVIPISPTIEQRSGMMGQKRLPYNPAEPAPIPKEGEVISGPGFTATPYSTAEKMRRAKEFARQRALQEKAQPVTEEMQKGALGREVQVGKKFGSGNKVFTESMVKDARASLKQKLAPGRLSSGIDPTAIGDLAKVGGYYIEGGVREFSAWSKKMVSEFGTRIKPHLRKIYYQAKRMLGNERGEIRISNNAEEFIKANPNATAEEYVTHKGIKLTPKESESVNWAFDPILEGIRAGDDGIFEGIQGLKESDMPKIINGELFLSPRKEINEELLSRIEDQLSGMAGDLPTPQAESALLRMIDKISNKVRTHESQLLSEFNEAKGKAERFPFNEKGSIRIGDDIQNKYFAESKVRDSSGKLMKVFHASHSSVPFNTFEHNKGINKDMTNIGFHFGTIDQANYRASIKDRWQLPKKQIDEIYENNPPKIYPVYINIKNPLRMPDIGFEDPMMIWKEIDVLGVGNKKDIRNLRADIIGANTKSEKHQILRDYLESNGYDGIVYENKIEGKGDSWIAFRPEQIKSIFNKKPTSNPNIMKGVVLGAATMAGASSTANAELVGGFDRVVKAENTKENPAQILRGARTEWNKAHPKEQYTYEDLKKSDISLKVGNWYYREYIPNRLKKNKIKDNHVNRTILYTGSGIYAAKNNALMSEMTTNHLIKQFDDVLPGVSTKKGVNVIKNKQQAKAIQQFLNDNGFYKDRTKTNVDGVFGRQSKLALAKFVLEQEKKNAK